MKVLLFGSGGFIGHNVSAELRGAGHEVVDTYRDADGREGYSVDLLDAKAVGEVMRDVQPEVIINCAGVVQNNETAAANPKHTDNILSQVSLLQLPVGRIVILGSAAEYGIVQPEEEPVREDTPLRATAPYGVSKKDEVDVALAYHREKGLPVVVARVFNPIGTGMPERQLVPRLIEQIAGYGRGEREAIEISRADSRRDYIDVRDLASALATLAIGPEPEHEVYNIGSGKATTNGELVHMIITAYGLPSEPPVSETMEQPEPNFAGQADISRLHKEYGWQPLRPLDQTVKEIVEDARK